MDIKVFPIGKIENQNGQCAILLEKQYRKGLKGLSDYGYVQILWWANGCDNAKDRSTLVEETPYKKGPEKIGVFALRAPERPNPIAVSNAGIAYVDEEKGRIGLTYVDADDETPVLDLKPYTPSLDRIEFAKTPNWCAHWPKSFEESGEFDWAAEFNF